MCNAGVHFCAPGAPAGVHFGTPAPRKILGGIWIQGGRNLAVGGVVVAAAMQGIALGWSAR